MNSLQHLTIVILLKQLKTREFWRKQTFLGLNGKKLSGWTKPVIRHSL